MDRGAERANFLPSRALGVDIVANVRASARNWGLIDLRGRYRTRYERLLGELPEANTAGEVSILCPFHEDHKRSASINLQTGLFHCLACEASHNYPTFRKAWELEHGAPDAVAPPDPDEKFVPEQVIRDMHFALLENQDLLDQLRDKRGISIDTVRKYQLGWHLRTRRVAIPIRDREGIVRNVRLYSFTEKGQQKMLSWQQGYGTARLWPLQVLDGAKYVFLCEGEMDRLVMADRGLNAITSTGGAKTWKSEWSKEFAGLKVYVVYDTDTAGEEGARKAAASISEYAKEVKVVRLDLSEPGEDITDFFVNYGYGVEDLKRLVKETPKFKKPIRPDRRQASNGKVEWATLGQSLKPMYRRKELMVPVIVSARRDERLHYPAETIFTCDQSAGRLCQKCDLYGSGEATIKFDRSDPVVLDFVGVSTKQQRAIIKKIAGIPNTCSQVESATVESGTIEEILVTPELDTGGDGDSLHLVQRAFYIGLGLDYNESYALKAKPIPFHKNGKIVHHVVEATPAHDSIETFEMTPEIYEQLKVFQAKPGKAKRKLWEIATDFQNHVTRIWDRIPMHIAMDLVWHSVLEFWFEDKLQRRGWLEVCIVGDTRTGKSEVAHQLQRHFGYGEIVSGENTSYAGLIGGAVKFDDAWFVKWGRIPLNDKRLVVIDEVTGMSPQDIALMSGVRETGIADITKIETQKANARTRAIWIGNVREPKNDLSDYDYGCLALHDLIGQPEDIARFDYALAAARDEVSSVTVNSRHDITGEPRYRSEACANLILWAWSRGRDTVMFQREAVDAAHKHAIEMGKAYTSNVPLVMAENQRIKLARIGAAIAARLFSTDEQGENLIVTAEHINAARDLLDLFYSAPAFGYAQLSRQRIGFARRRQAGIQKVQELLKTRPQLADMLSRTKLINPTKIADYTGITDDEAKDILRQLTSTMMVEDKGSHGYAVTSELKAIAEQNVPLEYELQ